jgi:uracil phosphoribosyltransferase
LDQSYLQKIRELFPLDTGAMTLQKLSTLSPSTRLYRVDTASSSLIGDDLGNCYIIDTPEGQRIASHPHLVGSELEAQSLQAAREFKAALKELDMITDSTGILHILRGSSGYMMHKVLPNLPLIRVRTEYRNDGYRAHSDDSRRIEVTYSDYDGFDLDTLIIPDTYATGRSVEAALQHMAERGGKLSTIIIYGFIAIPSMRRLSALCKTLGARLITFAICDITQLAANNYDMTLFGIDEHHHSATGELSLLGSILGEETLREMSENFIPGLDQPGDWSERQAKLFDGYREEPGDIKGHLSKSITFIESLDKVNRKQDWYNDRIKRLTEVELENLRSTISRY